MIVVVNKRKKYHLKIETPDGSNGPHAGYGTKIILIAEDGTEIDLVGVANCNINIAPDSVITADLKIFPSQVSVLTELGVIEIDPRNIEIKHGYINQLGAEEEAE